MPLRLSEITYLKSPKAPGFRPYQHDYKICNGLRGLLVNEPPSDSHTDLTKIFPNTLIRELSNGSTFADVHKGWAFHSARIIGPCEDDTSREGAYIWLVKASKGSWASAWDEEDEDDYDHDEMEEEDEEDEYEESSD